MRICDDMQLWICGDSKQVENHEVNEYASSVGAQVIGTSAKSGKGVQELFLELTKKLLARENAKPKNGSARSRGPKTKIAIVDDEPKKKDDGCCIIL